MSYGDRFDGSEPDFEAISEAAGERRVADLDELDARECAAHAPEGSVCVHGTPEWKFCSRCGGWAKHVGQ